MSRLVRLLVTALGLLLVAGCVSVPTSGPVREVGPQVAPPDEEGFAYDPRPPLPGATPAEIVSGFLDAMEATPISTTVAREYLTDDFAPSWDPSARTVTYAERRTPKGEASISVTLADAHWLDRSGAWRGALPDAAAELDFRLVREQGEWRIAEAPDALVVSQSWFQSRYTQVSLYFYDRTGRTLVPEPVFVPVGSQLATVLVRNLLRGPGPRLAGVVRSVLPTGGSEGLSVPVSDGVARVDITSDAGQPSISTQQLMAAQLAWTLRQDPTIERIRLTIDGRPVQFPDSGETFSVSTGMQHDPTGFAAGTDLYTVRGDELLSSTDGGEFEPLGGGWATDAGEGLDGVEAVVPDPSATSLAALTTGRRSVLVSGLATGVGLRPTPLTGTDLLLPGWDLAGRLWAVDRAPGGARVSYLADGTVREVRIPGITGRDVRDFLVSRDGTRFLAVVRGPVSDRVVVSRLVGDEDGRVRRGTRAEQLPFRVPEAVRIEDLAWQSRTTVVALQQLPGTALMHVLSVDGAISGFPAATLSVGGTVSQLVGSPVPGSRLYARVGGTLLDLSGSAEDLAVDEDAGPVAYPG